MTGDGGAAGARLIDLASRALGGSVLVANDETYAEKENRAAGRSGEQMLALLRERLGNDDATERDVVRSRLAEITSLRLRRLWGEGEAR